MATKSSRFTALLTAVCLLASASAFAIDSTWIGGADTDWHDLGNWSAGIPENEGDYARFNTAAAVTITSDVTLRILYTSAEVTLTVNSGATLAFSNGGTTVIESTADLRIKGAGEVTFSRNGTSETDFADMRPAAGTTITIDATITGVSGSGVESNAAGALRLTNTGNSFTGYARASGANSSILFRDPAVLGPRGIVLDGNPSKAVYDGAGPVTLALPIVFNSTAATTGTLENDGGGALTLTGDVYVNSATTRTIIFSSPGGQPIIASGTLSNGSGTLHLTHAGPGPLTLAGANAYTGTTTLNAPCTLTGAAIGATSDYTINQGGTLTLATSATINGRIIVNAGGILAPEHNTTFQNRTLQMNATGIVSFNPSDAPAFAVTLPVTNIVNGAGARWFLPATSFAITVPALVQQNNGTLDITAGTLGDANAKITVSNFPSGPLPGWITVNGGPAAYSDTLGIHAVTSAGAPVDLPATGPFNIPDAPSSDATINSQGLNAGPLTLAAPTTTLFSLTQAWAGDHAIIDLDGKTLAATALAINDGANHLTLSGGTLTGAGPLLALRNASPTSALTVNADITETPGTPLSLIKSGTGTVILGGAVTSTGPVLINDGALTLAIPADTTNTIAAPVSGTGALIKNGPGGLILNQTSPYTGGTTVNAGTLLTGAGANPLGATTAPVRIEDGGALDIAIGVANTIANPVFVQGHGPDGLGALRNSNPATQQINAFRNITLTDDTSTYALNRFDLRAGAFDFAGHSLTVKGGNQFNIVGSAISGVTPDVTVHAADGLFTFESSDFQGDARNIASANPGSTIALYNITAPMQWTLALSNNAVIRGGAGVMSTNVNVWAGPVPLPDTAARFHGTADGVLNFPNDITGPGGVIKEGPGWVWLHNTANTYLGATTVTQGTLYATAPGSLGAQTTNGLTVTETGTLFVRHAPGAWTKEQIEGIATTDTFTPCTTALGIDTVHEDLAYTATYPHIGLHKHGPHKLTAPGATGSDLGSITVYDGELDLSNTGAHNLHNQSITVGAGNTTAMTATLRLQDTALDTTDPGYNRAGPTITVGNIANSRGIIHVGADARLNGRLRMGVTGNASAGVIHQTGGSVTNTGGTGNTAAIGVNGYGYYRLEAGEFASKGNTLFSENSGSTAIFEQLGGTALINPGLAPAAGEIGDYYNGTFTTRKGATQFMLSGGTFNLNAHSMTLGEWGGDNSDGFAALTVENGAHILGLTTVTLANRNGNSEAYVNLKNGGTLTLRDNFIKGGNNAAGNTSRAVIAFNGGTLQVAPTASGPVSLVQTAANNSPTLLNVYEGGATIDTATPTGNTVLREPLRAPANFGVTAVNITSGGAGHIAPPFVSFTGGGGTGATAFAQIDFGSGIVTNIRVTSPGVGYTTAPTVAFRAGGFYTTLATATATLGGLVSGGLTKSGPGLLSLEAENTYRGATTVTEGTLRLAAGPKTLPENTPITLTGGTLDLGGATHTNYNPVTIESGGIVNGTLTAISFSKTGPGTATLGAGLAAIASPFTRLNAIIKALDPVIWYDPSDTTPGNIQLNGARVTRIRNKGRHGELLDAIPHNNGTGPLLNDTVSPLGTTTLHIDNATASMVSAADIPDMTGFAERTLVALIARDSNRASVAIGNGDTHTFEIGNDTSKTYLTGATLDLNLDGNPYPRPPADTLLFIAANNGYNGNYARGMQIWRYYDSTLQTNQTTAWGADNSLNPGPFIIGRRGTAINLGKHADMLLFDRVLTETELTTLKDALIAKYITAPADAGEAAEIPPIAVEAGTLILAPVPSQATIAGMSPAIWYDPSDTATVIPDNTGERVATLLNKGTRGAGMDASAGLLNNNVPLIAPRLKTGADTYSGTGLPMISVDANNEGLATTENVGITGAADRTTIGIFARNANNGDGTASAGPVYSFGAPTTANLWEFGDRHSRVVVGGIGGDNDVTLPNLNPEKTADVFIATYENQTVNFWRTLTEPLTGTLARNRDTLSSPLFIGQRAGTPGRSDFRGQIGEIIIFNRAITTTEREAAQAYLTAKWMTGLHNLPDGSEFNGLTFDIAGGAILDLGGSARPGVTVTGTGTITNGTLGAGFTISPAGDDATGELALNGITIADSATYRLTVDGTAADRLFIDGDLSALTVIPASDAEITGTAFVIATGAITHKPALSGFPSKFKLLLQGNDLLLTSVGGTVLILK